MRREKSARPAGGVASGPQSVSATAKVPLYQQIYLILREQIVSGAYKAGDILPSEADLGQIYSVSRITAKQALAELASAGLVSRFRGKGTVVNETQILPPLRGNVSDWMKFSVTMGRRTQVKVLEMDNGPATAEEAVALGLAEGAQVCRWLRVRHRVNEPFSVLRAVVPFAIGHDVTRDNLEAIPLLDLIQARGHKIGEARQVVTAILADQFLSSQLEVEVGSAILKLIRIVHDVDGKPVEYLTACYRPDRYQLEMVLSAADNNLEVGNYNKDVFASETAPI